MQNNIIENWYFKSLVKRAKKRNKERISKTMNRNKYATVLVFVYTHYRVPY